MHREFNASEYEAVDAWIELAITDLIVGRMKVPDRFLYDVNDGYNTVMIERLGRNGPDEVYYALSSEGWTASFTERGSGTDDDRFTFHDILLHGEEAFFRAVLMRQLATDVAV